MDPRGRLHARERRAGVPAVERPVAARRGTRRGRACARARRSPRASRRGRRPRARGSAASSPGSCRGACPTRPAAGPSRRAGTPRPTAIWSRRRTPSRTSSSCSTRARPIAYRWSTKAARSSGSSASTACTGTSASTAERGQRFIPCRARKLPRFSCRRNRPRARRLDPRRLLGSEQPGRENSSSSLAGDPLGERDELVDGDVVALARLRPRRRSRKKSSSPIGQPQRVQGHRAAEVDGDVEERSGPGSPIVRSQNGSSAGIPARKSKISSRSRCPRLAPEPLRVGGEALVEPDVLPGGHRHAVADPLVGEFVDHDAVAGRADRGRSPRVDRPGLVLEREAEPGEVVDDPAAGRERIRPEEPARNSMISGWRANDRSALSPTSAGRRRRCRRSSRSRSARCPRARRAPPTRPGRRHRPRTRSSRRRRSTRRCRRRRRRQLDQVVARVGDGDLDVTARIGARGRPPTVRSRRWHPLAADQVPDEPVGGQAPSPSSDW